MGTTAAMVTMIRKIKILLFSILIIWAFIPLGVNAQTTDFRARLSGGVSADITSRLKADLEYEHRFDKNLSTFDKAYLEPALSFEITKAFKVGASYRVMLDQSWNRRYGFEQRAGAFVRYDTKIDDFAFKAKTALQYGFDDLTNASNFSQQKLISRTAFEVAYNWFGSRFKPFASYEFFVHLNHPNGTIANQWRLKAGTDYKLSKKAALNVYYLFENEFNVVAPVDAHVLGAGFSYKL